MPHLIPAGNACVSSPLVRGEKRCKEQASCCIDCHCGRIGPSSAIFQVLHYITDTHQTRFSFMDALHLRQHEL